jgi:hypothetical protein
MLLIVGLLLFAFVDFSTARGTRSGNLLPSNLDATDKNSTRNGKSVLNLLDLVTKNKAKCNLKNLLNFQFFPCSRLCNSKTLDVDLKVL